MQLCGPEARTQLLAVRLEPWTPSPAFTIPAGSVAWLQLTRLPFSSEGLFGTAGGVGELHSIPAGAAPNVRVQANGDRESRDPSIVVGKAMTWQRLGLGPASWQVYSASNPGIQVVSCPIG